MGILDQQGRGYLRFIASHADLSPLAFYRTGENNRGRGEENEVDEGYIATAIDLSLDFILRAHADMRALFKDGLDSTSQKSQTALPNELVRHASGYIRQWQGCDLQMLIGKDASGTPLLCSRLKLKELSRT